MIIVRIYANNRSFIFCVAYMYFTVFTLSIQTPQLQGYHTYS